MARNTTSGGGSPGSAASRSYARLTPGERRVFHRILEGETTEEIGEHFGLSPFTVSNHLRRIFEKFGVNSRSRLMAQFVTNPFGSDTATSRGSTPAALQPQTVEAAIESIEGFRIKVSGSDAKSLKPQAYIKRYQRSARDSFTVGKWIEHRFQTVYPDSTVTVLTPDGKPASNRTSLGKVRTSSGRA